MAFICAKLLSKEATSRSIIVVTHGRAMTIWIATNLLFNPGAILKKTVYLSSSFHRNNSPIHFSETGVT